MEYYLSCLQFFPVSYKYFYAKTSKLGIILNIKYNQLVLI